MISLRPYQAESVEAILSFWQSGGGNPLVDLATGTGKSLVIAKLTQDLLAAYPAMRVLMLVHVRELVAQNVQALLRVWPDAPVGIYSAGLGQRDAHHRITFASIQSVFRRAKAIGQRDLILIDEAHLVPSAGNGMYRKLLDDMRAQTPDLRVAGFTATPYRLDTGRLDDGADRLFDRTVYSYGIGEGIRDGFLSPLISKASATEVDVSNVARRGGEFVAGELEAATDRITAEAVQEIVRFGADRRSWLVFCSGVKNAGKTRDALRIAGINAEMVHGETPSAERDRILRDFKAGRIRALAVAFPQRYPALPNVPTLDEQGLKGFEVKVWHGMYAPKGTPPDVLAKINAALKVALKDPEFIKKQEGLGAVVVTDKRVEPAEHKKFVMAEIAKWSPIIKAAGVYAD